MAYYLQSMSPEGTPRTESVSTIKQALLKRAARAAEGWPAVEVLDDTGRKLTDEELNRLLILEQGI